MSLFLAILAIGLLIVVHEGGHFLVARWAKMRVERFSIGFGPGLVKWKRGGTTFQLAPIPLGGFVQITGMNPHEDYDEKDEHVYPNRPTHLRFLTIFAGPATNILISSVFVFFVWAIAGQEMPTGRTEIGSMEEGGPAIGLLQPGDVILDVDGKVLTFTPGGSLPERVRASGGRPLAFRVQREGKPVTVNVTPQFSKERGVYRIGVMVEHELKREQVGVGQAALDAAKYPFIKSAQILVGLYQVITRQVPPDAVSIIGMTRMIKKQISLGWDRAFEFLALLSVYLGLFNLLPLPALDGGRLAFLVYELTTRRRPNPRVEAAVHMAGFLVLFLLMILVTIKDIKEALGG